eukprot:186313_1
MDLFGILLGLIIVCCIQTEHVNAHGHGGDWNRIYVLNYTHYPNNNTIKITNNIPWLRSKPLCMWWKKSRTNWIRASGSITKPYVGNIVHIPNVNGKLKIRCIAIKNEYTSYEHRELAHME